MRIGLFPVFAMALSATLALVSTTFAGEHVLTFDPDSSQVAIGLEATGHDIEGLFQLRGGEIRFDSETHTASGEILVDAVGAVTGNAKRDKTMHKKVLESEKHPVIVFRPESLEGTVALAGRSEIDLHGSMTLLGSEHPMTLHAEVEVDGDHLSAKTSFKVPFVDWGLHDPSIFLLKVAKQVAVEISAEGSLQTPLVL